MEEHLVNPNSQPKTMLSQVPKHTLKITMYRPLAVLNQHHDSKSTDYVDYKLNNKPSDFQWTFCPHII